MTMRKVIHSSLVTRHPSRSGEEGVALLTVLLLLIVLTIIGIASVTVTGLENRMAGFGRTGEAGSSAAESCLGSAVKIIQDTIDAGSLPNGYLSNAVPPGPVPVASQTQLNQEIMGQSDNNGDTADSVPANTTVVVNNFTVNGDIDRLYAAVKAGANAEFGAGATGGVDLMYRIDCVATNAATNTRSRITAVYACTATGESCQRKL